MEAQLSDADRCYIVVHVLYSLFFAVVADADAGELVQLHYVRYRPTPSQTPISYHPIIGIC